MIKNKNVLVLFSVTTYLMILILTPLARKAIRKIIESEISDFSKVEIRDLGQFLLRDSIIFFSKN